MWPWIKRWRDWAMHDLWPMHRNGPEPQALHFSYEKAGLTLHDPLIPWNAEAVVVEALVRSGPSSPAPSLSRKDDFQLRLPDNVICMAETLRREEGGDRHRVFFRLPPPQRTVVADVCWRNHVLGQTTLPILGREEFIRNLRVQMPTLFVRLGQQSVACQTFVATQCRGVLASALLGSPTSLVPLLDLDLQVEFRPERGTGSVTVPAQLCSTQLAGRQAMITVVPPRFPRRMGVWTVTWQLGNLALATQRIRGITQRHFHRSLRISDTRFAVQRARGDVSVWRQVPPLEPGDRVGPCFLVSSREPGMAGFCSFQVRAQATGNGDSPLTQEQEVLISDGPTVVAPGTVDAPAVPRINCFELRLKGSTLGVLSLTPTPTATFTSEGSFKPPENFVWTSAADEELNEKLGRLISEGGRMKAGG